MKMEYVISSWDIPSLPDELLAGIDGLGELKVKILDPR